LNGRVVDEQSPSAGGRLGRFLTWVGGAWIALVFLAGTGAFRRVGPLEDLFSAVGRSIFPALILLVVGRSLSRRSRTENREVNTVTYRPNQPQVRRPQPAKTPPPAARMPLPVAPVILPTEVDADDLVPESHEEFDPASKAMFDIDFESDGQAKPMTSKEMIEEAKRRLEEDN